MIKKISVLAFSLFTVVPVLAQAVTLTRQLDLGMKGSDVGILQTYLATDATIYPQGLVTNYFGGLTASAVSNFQSRNGLATVGRVGPQTLALLNSRITGNNTTDIDASIISNINILTYTSSATIAWNTNEPAKGVIYYSTSPLVTFERENSVDISGITVLNDTITRTSQSINLTSLQSGTTYYYMIYATDQADNVSVTSPSTFRTS